MNAVTSMKTMIANYDRDMQDSWRHNEALLLSYLLASTDNPNSMKYGGCAEEIFARVLPDDFYGQDYQFIYKICIDLQKDSITPNFQNVGLKLMELKKPNLDVTTLSYIGKLHNDLPFIQIADVINAVLTGSRNRKAAGLIADNFADIAHGTPDALHTTIDALTAIDADRDQGLLDEDPALDFAETHIEQSAWLQETPEQRDASRLKTGYKALDDMVFMTPSDFIILGGDTGIGKTCLATDISRALAKSGRHVAYFSLEIDKKTMQKRAIVAEGNVNSNAYIKGIEPMTKADWENSTAACDRLADGGHLRFIETCHTLNQILSACRTLHAQRKLDVVVVDHLQHISSENSRRSRYEELCDITQELRALALKYHVLVIGLSQFNRAEDNRDSKRPTLRSFRDSGSIEQCATAVLAIYRERSMTTDPNDPDRKIPVTACKGELLVLKNRNGENGMIPCYFDGLHQTYLLGAEAEKHRAADFGDLPAAWSDTEHPTSKRELELRDTARMAHAVQLDADRAAQQQAQEIEIGYDLEEND